MEQQQKCTQKEYRDSLVVQWLRIHLPMQGDTDSILGQACKILHAKGQLSPRATTREDRPLHLEKSLHAVRKTQHSQKKKTTSQNGIIRNAHINPQEYKKKR